MFLFLVVQAISQPFGGGIRRFGRPFNLEVDKIDFYEITIVVPLSFL
ncbi:Uncharacterised protein [Chlamydia trachomatis]|nr:Uncharacterised protein [Chlamydia trachomatis]